ncbi:MAG: Nif3-like dinuclear metal center hexameric protein [Deltaproteobacteria bacterium]|jgi:dinuclear metal center YbgI/SA1388 family protein|nr:Nif3-like dinuclear metal center hexameric protein [Deltaproteobacteria bacterium]
MRVRDFANLVEALAPLDLAESWDNSGLQVGDPEARVKRVALALDASLDTIQKAINEKAQLLITHHPLIFKPVKRLLSSDPLTKPAFLALANNLAILSAHTNWDMVDVAKRLAEVMELRDVRPLTMGERSFLKLVAFVPKGFEDKIRDAAARAGAGTIGKYEGCFFKAPGQGGFKVPLDAKPFMGTPGQDETAEEFRLEMILPAHLRDQIAQAVKAAHPYEEPAFEFYGLSVPADGFGAIGHWDRERGGEELHGFLSDKIKTPGLWAGKPGPERVKIVATLPGSGGDFIQVAKKAGADLFVTGEINHHHSLLAQDLGLPVFLAGHFESEYPSFLRLANLIKEATLPCGEVGFVVLDELPSIRHKP